MARRHGGLGRGLDALIPMREEVEKAMSSADAESVEILFNDDEETEKEPARDNFVKDRQIVSRETFEDNRVPDNKDLEERVPEKDSREELSAIDRSTFILPIWRYLVSFPALRRFTPQPVFFPLLVPCISSLKEVPISITSI